MNVKFDQLVETRRELYTQNQDLKQRNKQMIDKVKARNKKLNQELTAKQDQLDNPKDVSDVGGLERELQMWRRRVDDQKCKAEKKKEKLKVLADKHSEVLNSLKGVGGDQPGSSDEPQLKKMRVLENRLDKLMIKNNEALSIKQTYTVILQKFREEKVSYENQLQELEKSLVGKTATL